MLEISFMTGYGLILTWLMSRKRDWSLGLRLEVLIGTATILALAGYAVIKRMTAGLGAVTHLSDEMPWGIWITFDLCGIALASGGFMLAGLVHVLRLRRFEPILRPMVLTSFIAYQLVAAVLVLDLGRPQRFWHPLVMWQPHSVMFEITLCLSLYTLVLAFEFSPALFEKLGWHGLAHALHRLAQPVVMLGVILSTLHQSSFGSLFLIVPQKLSALWYTPLLPIQFLVSAMCAGLCVVILELVACGAGGAGRQRERLVLELSRAALWLLIGYGAIRVGDLVLRGAWRHFGEHPWLDASLAVELLVGILLPAAGFGRMLLRGRGTGVVPTTLCVLAGVVWHRINVSWLGLLPAAGVMYVPSWMELVITFALVLTGVQAFLALTQWLPVFPKAVPAEPSLGGLHPGLRREPAT